MSIDTEPRTEPSLTRVVCPNCDAINRVVRQRLGDSPVCGSCKLPLFSGSPIELSESKFRAQVAHSELPVIVDFWAPWCAPCRSMAPLFEQAAAQSEPRARFVKVNTDDEQALAASLGIRGIPTLAIFRAGKEVARTSGAMDLSSLIAWLKPHV